MDLSDSSVGAHAAGTAQNGAAVSTTQRKFGAKSLLLTASGPDSVQYADSDEWEILTTAEFTLEAWVYLNTLSADMTIMQHGTGSPALRWQFSIVSTGELFFGAKVTAGDFTVQSTGTLATGKWYHVAATRDSSNAVRLFINGVQDGSATISRTEATAGVLSVGAGVSPADDPFDGHIDTIDIKKSTARWTAAFGPPAPNMTVTTPDDITGLKLWLRGSVGIVTDGSGVNTWADQSGDSNNAATPGGQPDLVTAGLDTRDTVKFVAANSDYMSIPSATGTIKDVLSAGVDWTMFWVAKVTSANFMNILSTDDASDNNYQFADQQASSDIFMHPAGVLAETHTSDSDWHHKAFMRDQSAGNLRAWRNGVEMGDGTNADTTTWTAASEFNLGAEGNLSQFFDGEIAELILFTGALSVSDMVKMHKYLRRRYPSL